MSPVFSLVHPAWMVTVDRYNDSMSSIACMRLYCYDIPIDSRLYTCKEGKKGRDRPRETWIENIKEELKEK